MQPIIGSEVEAVETSMDLLDVQELARLMAVSDDARISPQPVSIGRLSPDLDSSRQSVVVSMPGIQMDAGGCPNVSSGVVSDHPEGYTANIIPLTSTRVLGEYSDDRSDAHCFMWVVVLIKNGINTASNIVVMVGSLLAANDAIRLGIADEDMAIWFTMAVGLLLQLALSRRTRGEQYLDFFTPMYRDRIDGVPARFADYFPVLRCHDIRSMDVASTIAQMVFMFSFGSAWTTNALSIVIASQRFQAGDYCHGVTGRNFAAFVAIMLIMVSSVMIAYWLAWRAKAALDFVVAVSKWPGKLRNVLEQGVTVVEVFTALIYLVTLGALGAQTFAFTEFFWDTTLRLLTTDGRNYGGMDGGCAVGDDFERYVWITYLCGAIATAGFLMAEMESLRTLIVRKHLSSSSLSSWLSCSSWACPSCSDISSATLAVGETAVNTMLPNYYAVLTVFLKHGWSYKDASAMSLFMALLKGTVHLTFNYVKSHSGGGPIQESSGGRAQRGRNMARYSYNDPAAPLLIHSASVTGNSMFSGSVPSVAVLPDEVTEVAPDSGSDSDSAEIRPGR